MNIKTRIATCILALLFFTGAAEAATLFEGDAAAKAIQGLLEQKGKTLKALDIVVYPERILVKAQDLAKPENVDEYTLTAGGISDPAPVRLMGGGNLDQNVFAIAEVKFDTISRLVAEALTKTNPEGGTVSHVIIKRNLPFSKEVYIRVFVNGTRKFGFVDNDVNGTFKKVTFS